jgi:hypothetical protein
LENATRRADDDDDDDDAVVASSWRGDDGDDDDDDRVGRIIGDGVKERLVETRREKHK